MNKKIIYDLILVILLIGTIICAGTLFLYVAEDLYHSPQKDTYLWNDVENGKYYNLYTYTRYNKLIDAKETELFKQCETIADYYMAANHYKISSELGREAEAKQYKKEMESLLPKLKEHEDVIEDIHHRLKIPY